MQSGLLYWLVWGNNVEWEIRLQRNTKLSHILIGPYYRSGAFYICMFMWLHKHNETWNGAHQAFRMSNLWGKGEAETVYILVDLKKQLNFFLSPYVVGERTYGGQRVTCENLSSTSTMWFLGVELRLLDLTKCLCSLRHLTSPNVLVLQQACIISVIWRKHDEFSCCCFCCYCFKELHKNWSEWLFKQMTEFLSHWADTLSPLEDS